MHLLEMKRWKCCIFTIFTIQCCVLFHILGPVLCTIIHCLAHICDLLSDPFWDCDNVSSLSRQRHEAVPLFHADFLIPQEQVPNVLDALFPNGSVRRLPVCPRAARGRWAMDGQGGDGGDGLHRGVEGGTKMWGGSVHSPRRHRLVLRQCNSVLHKSDPVKKQNIMSG